MTPAIWTLSIPLGFAMTFGARFLSLGLQIKSGVPLKNDFPREQVEGKEVAMKDTNGYVRRAYAAHQNSWEAMILWVSAVLTAKVQGVDEATMNNSAIVFLATRALYIPAYVLIRTHQGGFFRTAIYTVGMVTSFRLLIAAALVTK